MYKQADLFSVLATLLPGVAAGAMTYNWMRGRERKQVDNDQVAANETSQEAALHQQRLQQVQEGLNPVRFTNVPGTMMYMRSQGGRTPLAISTGGGFAGGPADLPDDLDKLSSLQAAYQEGHRLAEDLLEKRGFTFKGLNTAAGVKELGGKVVGAPGALAGKVWGKVPWQAKLIGGGLAAGGAYGAYKAMDTATDLMRQPEASPHASGMGPAHNINEWGQTSY